AETMHGAIASEAYRPIVEDSAHFLADTRVVVGRQQVVVPVAEGAGQLIKRMSILRRLDGMSPQRFADEWGRVH
ncbi:hypothetical protein, partial [Escherichia coli]|uniref:hypothetical protein n=1 Tax=Escherichia coli TaxID=562 RepID=UPI001953BD6C